MSKRSRTKGKAYENDIAKLFRSAGWKYAKRHLEYQSGEASFGRDLDGTEPFAVQVKCWGKTPSISAIEEIVVSDTYPIRMAVLKRTRNAGSGTLEVAVVDLDTMLYILEILRDGDGLLKLLSKLEDV